MINDILLNENWDDSIIECLMYEDFKGEIKDSGKSGDMRIYAALKEIEKEFNIKL